MFEAISMHPNPSILMTCKNIYVFLSKFPFTLTQKGSILTQILRQLVYIYICIFVSTCLPVFQSVIQSVSQSVCLSVYMSFCMSVSLWVSLYVYLSVCVSVCPSVCVCVCLSVCLSATFHNVRANLIHSSSPAHLQKAKKTKQNHTYLIYKCVCLDHSLVIHRWLRIWLID
jgi:hypothetical protein